jgi:hypothetical protein
MIERTALIDATIDRIDTDLVCAQAGRAPTLYRLTMQDICYFIDANDVASDSFKLVTQLSSGVSVRVCVIEERGRRKVAWLTGAAIAIAPREVFGEMRLSTKVLAVALCMLALTAYAAAKVDSFVVIGLASSAATLSLVACILFGAVLIKSLDARRREAQRSWRSR